MIILKIPLPLVLNCEAISDALIVESLFLAILPIFKEENLLKTKEGSSWRRLQFGITDGVTTQYVEVSEFGAGRDFETQVNKTSGDGFEKEIISWSDRHNPKVIEKVAGFRQLTLNLGSDKETKQTGNYVSYYNGSHGDGACI